MNEGENWETREQELEAARDRYQMLFENNPIVIWEHDFSKAKAYVDGLATAANDLWEYLQSNPTEVAELFDRVQTNGVNQNAVEYYRADSKEHLLNNVDQVLGEEAWNLTIDLWQSIADGKTRFRGETVAQTFDGERRHQILDLYVPEAHADDYGRVYMTGTDINELKRREHELERERDRLDEFASIVSHDLRNPLNVAQGRIELAQQNGESEHLQDALEAINRSLELIEDMLTLARAGKHVSEMESVDLASLVRVCENNVEIPDATINVDLHTIIKADRSRVSQLFENLIRNAVEHGSDDVTVTVGKLERGFFIEDDGPGIPIEDRGKIFDAGYSSNPEGTGFGLGIVSEIVEAHGWEINITEGSEGGARFEITSVEFTAE